MVLDPIIIEEIKSVCNCPERFTLLDFIGAGFGAFFVIDGLRRTVKNKKITPAPTIETVFGSAMVYIHTKRFFYAEQLGIKQVWQQ